MASTTPPTRIDHEVYESARAVASVMSRSTAQQISHWARIGREIEASPDVSMRAVADVLSRSRAYDSLSPEEQAVVRVRWSEGMTDRRVRLDLSAAFAAEGRPFVELDADGSVIERRPDDAHNDTRVPLAALTSEMTAVLTAYAGPILSGGQKPATHDEVAHAVRMSRSSVRRRLADLDDLLRAHHVVIPGVDDTRLKVVLAAIDAGLLRPPISPPHEATSGSASSIE